MRPTREDLEAARGRTLPDVLAPGLRVVLSGINPSLWSAATGHHFARPGNRFWPALHASGLTPRLLHPREQGELLSWGLGLTNVCARATARADELSLTELVEGGELLREKVRRLRPAWLAVVGVTAYRTAFGAPKATVGRQHGRWGLPRSGCCPTPAASTPTGRPMRSPTPSPSSARPRRSPAAGVPSRR